MAATYNKYLILGAGRSGIGAAKFLSQQGIAAVLFDSMPYESLTKSGFGIEEAARLPGVECHFGQNPDNSAIESCSCVIASPGVPPDAPPLEHARACGIPVLSEIEFASGYYKGKLVAVTGTNGKTTTTSLVAHLLSRAGIDAHAAGNIGDAFVNYAGVSSPRTVLALEISSFQLDQTEGFHPNCAVLTNITPDHLDRHGTMENYTAAKEKVFQLMGGEDLLVANLDDPIAAASAAKAACPVSWFSLERKEGAHAWLEGGAIWAMHSGKAVQLAATAELKIIGSHNAANAMAASLAALFMGASLETVQQALKDFEPVEHRLEFVRNVRGVSYVNDSKGTNPDATAVALRAVAAPAVVLLGGYDKHSSFDSLAPLLREKARCVIVLGQTKEKIAEMLDRNSILYVDASSFDEAVKLASEAAEPGDTVLLSPACASWDMFGNYEERGRLFKNLVHNL
ncbi:MAG: UDP-N-acetylmuramoyl-L-alanine--D-glutamate ligase [Eubacteriaceae bacterium]|nr:UDP-N-acetylmuramoyl-L-alanine--D-glutamate ligase [Eubacteriaceae bacterium]